MFPYIESDIATDVFIESKVRPGMLPIGLDFHDIVYVYFSKDRPMQLDLTLRSNSFHNWDLEYFQKEVVLYKATDPVYESGYAKLKDENKHVIFFKEEDFKADLLNIIGNYNYVVFVVDDTIFVRDYSSLVLCRHIESLPSVLGASLRLGKNTEYCYPLDREQRVPPIENVFEDVYEYDWTRAEGDFGYPLEVSSSIYPIHKIQTALMYGNYSNPNDLEWILSQYSNIIAYKYPNLLMKEYSAAFSNPVNKVQTVNHNRSGSTPRNSPLNLAERFLNGDRIDINPFYNYTPRGCHQEVEYTFINESEL